MMKFKTQVSKQGDINFYINKPVINRSLFIDELVNAYMFNEIPKDKVIGIISEAVELEDCYELTINIWTKYLKFDREFFEQGRLCSMIMN